MCLTEARPTVLMIFLLRFLVGAAMDAGIFADRNFGRILLTALAWELAVFSAYLFNGVMDVHEDRVNGSHRPIARGTLSVALATRVAGGAAMLSLLICLVLGTEIAVAVLILLILGWLYSGPPAFLKRRTLGTPFTCVTYGMLTYFVGFAAAAGDDWSRPSAALFMFAGAMSLWMGLVGVPAKDLSDVSGDAAAGRRTLPVVCGDTAIRYAMSATACVLAITFCLVSAYITPPLNWANVVMLGGAAAVAAISLSRSSRIGRPQLRRPFRAFMATQYLVNLCALTPVVVPL
jgi:4-hydroxybenzoate polyprenyltransferase